MYMYKGIKTRIAIYNVCLSCLLFTYGVYGAITHVYQHKVTQYTQVSHRCSILGTRDICHVRRNMLSQNIPERRLLLACRSAWHRWL